jgi:mono/diheme cytochrome c family protein
MGLLALAVLVRAEEAGAWRSFPSAAGISRGEQVYADYCAVCHGAGVGMPGTDALKAKYRGLLPELLTERKDLSPAFIREVVRRGISTMPFYRKTELTDADLEALVGFLSRSSANRKQTSKQTSRGSP